MTDFDQLKGTPFDNRINAKKIPGSLNTLTILTFVGCGLIFCGNIYQLFTGKATLDMMEKMQGSEAVEKMPDFAKKMYSPESIDLLRVTYENRYPLLVITLVGLALCVVGARQMRELKKQGYFLWLLGEILPLIGSIIFVGMRSLQGLAATIILSITALFILLYSLNVKHLK